MLSDTTKDRLLQHYRFQDTFNTDEFLSDANRIVLIAKIIDKLVAINPEEAEKYETYFKSYIKEF